METTNSGADFFDSKNKEACALREQAATLALQDMLKWLDNEQQEEDGVVGGGGGAEGEDEYHDDDGNDDVVAQRSFSSMNPECLMSERYSLNTPPRAVRTKRGTSKGTTVRSTPKLDHSMTTCLPDIVTKEQLLKRERIAIFDATNSTNARRQWILDMCTNPEKRGEDKPTGCVFIESICDDEELLMENYLDKVSNSPDYANMSKEDSIVDLKQRVQKYEEQYETMTTDELSYIKIYNLSSKIMANQIYGRMSKLIVPASKCKLYEVGCSFFLFMFMCLLMCRNAWFITSVRLQLLHHKLTRRLYISPFYLRLPGLLSDGMEYRYKTNILMPPRTNVRKYYYR